jgi:hypothetical protein
MPNAFFYDQGFGNRGTNVTQSTRWTANQYVKPYTGLDANRGDSPIRARKSIQSALTQVQASTNSRIIMMAESDTAASTTDYYTTSLLYNVDGTHLIGANSSTLYSQRSRIAAKSSLTTGFGAVVTFSANDCYWENIEVFYGIAASTASCGAMLLSGNRNHFVNCHIAGIGHATADVTTAYSLKISGSENLFERCVIGLDTIQRTAANAEIRFAFNSTTGYGAARNVFRDCRIVSYGTSSHNFVEALAGSIDRDNTFENCTFINMPTGIAGNGTQMAQAFSMTTGSSPDGIIILKGATELFGVTASETTQSGRLYYVPYNGFLGIPTKFTA